MHEPQPAEQGAALVPPRCAPAQPRDALLAGVLIAVSVALLFIEIEDPTRTVVTQDPDVVGVLTAVLPAAMIALHRRLPVTAALVALTAAGGGSIAGYSLALPFMIALVLVGYAAIHTGRRTTVLLGLFTGSQVAGLAVQGFDDPVVFRGFAGFCVGLVPVLIGNVIRTERIHAAEARERTRQVEQLRDRDVEQAVVQERLRIARDVHDITGHHLSAISLQAAGAGRMTRDPVASEALERIHGLTTTALGQTRRALGVLRASGPAELAPAPRLAQVDELLSPARDAGLVVDLRRRGEERPLPDEVELCAYRVVQESLTNVVRHAAAHEVVVRVEFCDGELFLAVDDDGVGGPPRRHGGGIDGMRERVALVGGTLDAGPVGRRGWSVRATLPLKAAA